MAQPLRRAILAAFANDRRLTASAKDLFEIECVEVAALANDRLSNVIYHCGFLKDAGLLEVVDVELIRGATKSILGLTDEGDRFLDGEGNLAQPESALDQMAAQVRQHGADSYPALVELLASTGRKLTEAS